MTRIFICDYDTEILRYLGKLLSASGYQVEAFTRGIDLLQRFETGAIPCDVLLQDVRMADMNGLQVLKQVRKRAPELPVVVMTADGSIDDAVHAIKLGAYDYITKPFPKEKLLGVLERLLDHRRLSIENSQLRKQLQRGSSFQNNSIVFKSARFREVYDLTLQVAESEANILIQGESGTGKELIAGTIHTNSPRAAKPFVSLNCAALSDTLLESQLFGHVRGAFTGAVINQKGLIEEADGGTLFLDEIGDISPAMQAKLLRVIQEKDFMAVGSTKPRKVDVRFVAATNKDLMVEVAEGRFREDLYYRLNVITINLPPLRERREDIEPLAGHFLRVYTRKMKKDIRGIDEEALQVLLNYEWPGNVRELENVIERAVILARSELITPALLPVGGRRGNLPPQASPMLMRLDEIERQHIESVLTQNGFHKSRAAGILGISRKTLDRKIVEYGLGGNGQR